MMSFFESMNFVAFPKGKWKKSCPEGRKDRISFGSKIWRNLISLVIALFVWFRQEKAITSDQIIFIKWKHYFFSLGLEFQEIVI